MNTEFLGRLHPLLVHFPVGILFMAFLLEMLSNFGRFRKVRGAVPFSVLIGLLASIFSALTGWFLSQEGGYEPDLLFRHRLFGFMTIAIALMLWVVITYGKNLPKPKRRPVRMAVFVVMVVILTITGHFGGSLTHGRGYLSLEPEMENVPGTQQVKTPVLVYQDIVRPILDKKCVSCHGEKKQKGKLRLDTEVFISKGGKEGTVLLSKSGKSELLHRIALPLDNEDHMPPVEKEQLTNLEIELLSDWVKGGASFTIPVKDFTTPSMEQFIQTLNSPGDVSWWPDAPAQPASEKALEKLSQYGVVVHPISIGNNYLDVKISVENKRDEAFWQAYSDIAANIVVLDLSGLKIRAEDLKRFSAAKELRKLYLTKSDLNGTSLNALLDLKQLRYLNLVSSGLKYDGFSVLSEHPALREIYVFGNNWTPIQLKDFLKKNSAVRIDTGNNQLPFRKSDTVIYTP